jgi:hypothetical protein
MNKIDLHPPLASMDEDYALWCAQQGALLRAGRFGALDRENVAEEIESLGRSDKREIESRLRKLLTHLLNYQFQAAQRSNSWRATIRDQRRGIRKLVDESPSLASYPSAQLSEEYEAARWEAVEDTGLSEHVFSAHCPFTIEQVLDPDYLPDQAA